MLGKETWFLLAICQIPLYPPLLKGDFIIPLFDKEGLGEIFKGLVKAMINKFEALSPSHLALST